MTEARKQLAGLSSSTRGIFGGGNNGSSNVNTIDYITIASAGNATDYGDLLATVTVLAGASSHTIGLFGGGFTGSNTNVISTITIASTGNSTDFGDLTVARRGHAGLSSAHGGLQ